MLREVDLRDRLIPAPGDIEGTTGSTDILSLEAEIATLKERLARQQALRRDLERELAESRSRQRDLERRLNSIQRTFTYRLGEALVAGRSLKGMFEMPGRFWRMWTDFLDKRRLEKLRLDAAPDARFAEHLAFVNHVLDAHQADGLAAARSAAAALPDARPREKARAVVELAHVALAEDRKAAIELAAEGARLNPAETRLKAFAFNLFDLGEISAAARMLETARDLEFHPGDLPRRHAIAAYSNWRSGLTLGARRETPAAGRGVLVVEGLSGQRTEFARRRAEAVASGYAARGLAVGLVGAASAPQGVKALPLAPSISSPAALDLIADERAAMLETLITSESVGLVHAGADLVSAIAAVRAARATGARVVLDLDSLPAVRRQRGPAWDTSEGFRICAQALDELVAAADLLAVRTPALARAIESLTGRKPDVVMSDVATARLGRSRAPTLVGLEPTDRVVLLPRFSEAEPRSLAVVEAIAEVARTIPNVRLVPVGVGRDFGPLRQRAHDLGIKDRLIAAEAARGPIEDLVARAQVLLLDDTDTGVSGLFTPASVAEARHLGVPMVVVAGAWSEGLVDSREAWLAEPDRPADLAQQILAALGAGRNSLRIRRARERGETEARQSRAVFGEQLARMGF